MIRFKKHLKGISLALACLLAVTGALPANAANNLTAKATETTAENTIPQNCSTKESEYAIYPIPQSITYGGSEFTLSDEVVVVAETGVDSYTVNFLEEVLTKYGVTYTTAASVQAGKTNILLGVKGSGKAVDQYVTANVTVADASLFTKNDAYLLTADSDAIVICGKDTDSVYYGVATLQMMLSSFDGRKLLTAQIEDYATVETRGYIEGFYGAWNFEEREELMRFAGNYKMNSYVYAAKGDAYHTSKWDVLYPADMLSEFENLVNVGKETKVEFGWAIHLTNFFHNLDLTNTADYEGKYAKLTAKLDQLYGVGVRRFDVLCDDFAFNATNETVVTVLNRLNTYLTEKGCDPLVYCPRGYNQAWAGNGAELEVLKGLDAGIKLYWTGADVNAPITQETVTFLKERSNHEPDYWLNYPVNEHGKSGIYLGDITHYARDNVKGLGGFHSNPSRFAYSNEVGLYQLAALVWNNNNYSANAVEVWESAFNYLQPEVKDAYLTIARNVSNCPNSSRVAYFPESEYLAEKLEAVQALVEAGTPIKNNQAAKDIAVEFNNMITAVEKFRADCANRDLVTELEPWLKSLNDLAHAGIAALASLTALEDDNTVLAWEKLSEASRYSDSMYSYNTIPGDAEMADVFAKAGSRRLAPFVSKAINAAKNALTPILNPGDNTVNPVLFARIHGVAVADDANGKKMYDGDETTAALWNSVQMEGDYYGLDLGRVITVTDVSVLQGSTDADHDIFHDAVLQYSENGSDWKDMSGVSVEGSRITAEGLNVKARYVRYYLKTTGFNGKPDFWTHVREFTVNKEAEQQQDRVYTNVEALKETPLTLAGSELSVRDLTNIALAPGEYVGIRLANPAAITEFVQDTTGAEGLTFEYSYNEKEWTAVPETLSGSVAAKYLRLVNKTDAAVTADISKIGFDVNATIADMKVAEHNLNNALKEGTFENMFDGDLTTYAWTNEPQQNGDYIIVDLGSSLKVHDVRIATADGNPKFYHAEVQLSADKTQWTTIASVPDSEYDNKVDNSCRFLSADAGGQDARYLRILLTGDSGYYLKIHEIEVNKNAAADDTASPLASNLTGKLSNIVDSNISTLFTASAGAGSYVEYRISENTNVEQVSVVQGQAGTGKIYAVTPSGKQLLGILDTSVKTFDTIAYEAITAIRIEWDAAEEVVLHELYVTKGTYVTDDIGVYVEPLIEDGSQEPEEPVNLAPGKAVTVSGTSNGNLKENVNDESLDTRWESDSIKGVNAQENAWIYIDLGDEKQYEISKVVAKYFKKVYPTISKLQVSDDAATWRTVKELTREHSGSILDPVDEMILEPAETARYVRILLEEINSQAAGDGVSIKEFEIYGVEKQTQPEPADKTALEALITEAAETDTSLYTEESAAALNAAIEAARAVLDDAEATQDEVNAQLTALQAAIDGLEEKPAAQTNLALGKEVVSNGCEIEGAANEGNVNDGDIATRWDGVHLKGDNAQEDSWIYIDLGADKQYEISSIVAKYFNKVYPTDYDVQVSNDTETWTIVETITKADDGPTHPEDTITLEEPVTARYVRLFFRSVNSAAGGNGVAVTEFEIYGTEKEAQPGCTHETTTLVDAKEATCKEAGYTGDTVCIDCGETIQTGTVIPKAEHDTELRNAKAATCKEAGYTGDMVCKACGETIQEGTVIPKAEHDTELRNAKAATCTEDGYSGDNVCKACGETIQTGLVLTALGHQMGEWKVVKEATATEDGLKERACTREGCTYKETEVIPKTGEVKPAADKTALDKAIKDAAAIKTDKYTDESVAALNKAIAAAEAVAADKDATQAEVDAAKAAVDKAVKDLTEKSAPDTSAPSDTGSSSNSGQSSETTQTASPKTADTMPVAETLGIFIGALTILAVFLSEKKKQVR